MHRLLYIFWVYTLIGPVGDCQRVVAQNLDLRNKFERLLHKGIDSLQTQQELQEASKLCQDFIKEYDKSPGDSLLIINAYLLERKILKRQRRGNGDVVIGELKRGLRRQPNNPDLNREIGLELMELEKFVEAKPYLEKAVQLKRDDKVAWRALIDLYEKHGNLEERISAFQSYLAVDSTNADIWMKLGETYLKLDKKKEAEHAFAQAVRYYPQESLAHLQLALLKEERRDWVGAEKEFKAVLEYDPANAIAKEHLPTVQSHAQEDKAINQSLQNANLALQSRDPRKWESARTDLLDVLERKPETQEAKEQLTEVRRKLYNYWYSEGLKADSLGRKSDLLLARAADCFTVSVVYADSKQARDRAFDRYRQASIKLNRKMDARNAQEAAQRALATKEFDKALRKLTEALALDTSLSEEIQPKISETERQINIKYLESRYRAAMEKRDWYSARTYLQELRDLAPDTVRFEADLEIVARVIVGDRVWYTLRIIILIFGGMMIAFLPFSHRFREAFLNLLRKLSALISRQRYGNFAAIFVIFLLGYIYYRLYQSKIVPSWETLPGLTVLGGIIVLCVIIIMALIRKRIPVSLNILSKRISFVLMRPTKLIPHALSVESLQLKAVAGLTIEKGGLRESQEGSLIAENNITFRPYGGATVANVEFLPINAHIDVKALSFSPDTWIFFEKEGRKISLTFKQGNLPNSMELPERFFVKVSGCEIICEGRSILRTAANKPVTLYGEVPRFNPIVQFHLEKAMASLMLNPVKAAYAKNGQFDAVMVKNLSFREKDAFLEARQSRLSLSDEEYETEQGNYEIMLHNKEFGDLTSDLRWILKPNLFDRLKMGFGEGASFRIECEGKFSAFRVGKLGNWIEKIPTMLSWFVEEKRELAVIIGVLFGIAGFIVSIFDLTKP